MTHFDFHEWLLNTYGENSVFTICEIQQHLGFERKKVRNYINRLRDKNLITRQRQSSNFVLYRVHESEFCEVDDNIIDPEHKAWMEMVENNRKDRLSRQMMSDRL